VTPPPAAAQRAATVRTTRVPDTRVAAKRPALRILDAPARRRGRGLRFLAACVLVGSLLAVVVAHSMLAQSQVRLTAVQDQLTAEQAVHRQLLSSVAAAENPAQIIAEAQHLNLATPGSVIQLPAVPLTTPLGQSTATTGPTTTPTASGSGSGATTKSGTSASAGK
jgi:hypothetical protein